MGLGPDSDLPASVRHDATETRLGDVAVVWVMWAVMLLTLGVTYARLEPSKLYHVTRSGLGGGLSRMLVEANFPLALVAIAIVFITLDALPAKWWWVGGPAIVLCAVVAWPGVVDDGDLDARLVNVPAALGVVAALTLTVAAARRVSITLEPRRGLDAVRATVIGIVLLLSLPWIAGNFGLFLPEGIFIADRPITGSNGRTAAAVHLGQHHGFHGTLLVISALILSRSQVRSAALAGLTRIYLSLMVAYGAVNFTQDYWNEQLVKRDWIDWRIPTALEPALHPIWLVIIALTVFVTWMLAAFDQKSTSKLLKFDQRHQR